jgi:hypothetical protein
MRSLLAALAVLAAALVGVPAAAATAAPPSSAPDVQHAKKAKKLPELVVRQGRASYTNGRLDVSILYKNKGDGTARRSLGAFAVSKDRKVSDDDLGLGEMKVGKLKAGRSSRVRSSVVVPTSVPEGKYYIVYCADYDQKVRESNEGNNCGGSKKSVTITRGTTTNPTTPNAPGTITVSSVSTGGGVVSASATGGTCSGSVCTVAAGAHAVTFTPNARSGYHFAGWTCNAAYTGAGGNAIRITNATSDASCVADFDRDDPTPSTPTQKVTITFSVMNGLLGSGSVSAAATNGLCTGTIATATTPQSCTFDSGVGSLTLTASSVAVWSGSCTGLTTTQMFSNPTRDATCAARFGL